MRITHGSHAHPAELDYDTDTQVFTARITAARPANYYPKCWQLEGTVTGPDIKSVVHALKLVLSGQALPNP
jgi:hypothetical protein